MKEPLQVSAFELVICLSHAMDLVSRAVVDHHKRVAFMAMRIGQEMGLSEEVIARLVFAGLIHDAGALSTGDDLHEFYYDMRDPHAHAETGYRLLAGCPLLAGIADTIRHHHVPWRFGEGAEYLSRPVSLASHILHLAERVAVLINENDEILGQSAMFELLVARNKGNLFVPVTADALLSLSSRESFWFDLVSDRVSEQLSQACRHQHVPLEADRLVEISLIFCQIIDFRSHFTTTHSSAVGICAEALARHMGMDSGKCHGIKLAGFLHDLGKLAIPKWILEKPGPVNEDEFNLIKAHPYHTYDILRGMSCFKRITPWAAFHHERPNGTGYPFHIRKSALPKEACIIAVADVFTSLTEKRPYRGPMPLPETLAILHKMVHNQALDADCVAELEKHREEIDHLRRQAQDQSALTYEAARGKT